MNKHEQTCCICSWEEEETIQMWMASVAQQIHKPDKILVNLIEICEGYHDENLQQLRSVVQW